DPLVEVGFKEIEIGFPAASQADFDFVGSLTAAARIPDDVTAPALTQPRQALLRRTFASLKAVSTPNLHLNNSASVLQREKVFKLGRDGIRNIAVNGAKEVLACARQAPETEWIFQYSPESFTGTEPDFAVEVCNAVAEVWQPTPERKVIFNLPSTVEMATP